MIIEFGAWQLRPTANGLNWELFHRHEMRSGKDVGAVKWKSCGRFYQYGGLDMAVAFAADCDAKEKDAPHPVGLDRFIEEYRAITDGLTRAITDGLTKAVRDATSRADAR